MTTINDRLRAALETALLNTFCPELEADLLRELAAQGLAVVPVEPTDEMVTAGIRADESEGLKSAIYKAMIGAAK